MSRYRGVPDTGDISLVDGPFFRLDRIDGIPDEATARRYRGCLLVIPREGTACVGGEPVAPGECALAHSLDEVVFEPRGSCLIAQPAA
jgi:mannose-6-phosphate isomerase